MMVMRIGIREMMMGNVMKCDENNSGDDKNSNRTKTVTEMKMGIIK